MVSRTMYLEEKSCFVFSLKLISSSSASASGAFSSFWKFESNLEIHGSARVNVPIFIKMQTLLTSQSRNCSFSLLFLFIIGYYASNLKKMNHTILFRLLFFYRAHLLILLVGQHIRQNSILL